MSAIYWKAETDRIQKLWDDDHELLVDRVAFWKEKTEEMQARALKAEAERDAALRAVADAPHAEDCAFWHDWHNEGKCDCWVSKHRPVIEAARKMGDE